MRLSNNNNQKMLLMILLRIKVIQEDIERLRNRQLVRYKRILIELYQA